MVATCERTEYKLKLRKIPLHELLKSKDINGVQWTFWFYWEDNLSTRSNSCFLPFLAIEAKLRECTQQEAAVKLRLKEVHERLRQDNYRDSDHIVTTELKPLEQKAKDLSKEYWLLERKLWSERLGSLEKYLGAGITLWRKTPNWWMHERLVLDCINRGGCCGRSCNCCFNRQKIRERPHAKGHCTTWCHCCEKARGFKISSEEAEMLENRFGVSSQGYMDFIALPSLLGIVEGDFSTNPSDMIKDKPPEYTSKSKQESIEQDGSKIP